MTTPPEFRPPPAYPPMAPVQGPPGAVPSDVPWRRLDQRMLLVAPLQELGRGLIPIVVILFTGFGDPVRLAITVAGAIGLVAWGVTRYLTTTYRVTAEQVQIRRGLLTKSTSVAPIDRVRSVDVTAPALHRMLGLGKVVVGTGRTDKRGRGDLVLDSLGVADAERLRRELLHRAPVDAGTSDGSTVSLDKDGGRVPLGASTATGSEQEQELVRLRYSWLRYAPFTLSGAITALVIVGVGFRLVNEIQLDPDRSALIRSGLDAVERTPLWIDVVGGLVGVVVVVSLLSVLGYVLAFHGFRLTRRPDGTLHVARGLITRRETTLEHRRVRGVEVVQTLLLRAVRGAKLGAIATGVRNDGGAERTASLLVPPSPVAVDLEVGARVVDDPTALDGPLVAHGPAATRRRLTRALVPTLVPVGALVALAATGVLPAWAGAASLLLLVVAALLGVDRARSLGHRVGGPLVVTRSGSLVRRRSVVSADGVIGAVVRSSLFQRRAGVATVLLTTAAGRQAYPITDVGTDHAWEVVREVLPAGTVGPEVATR